MFSPGETWVAFFTIANNGGPSFLDAGNHNLPMLEEAVNDVLNSDAMQVRARDLGTILRNEDGVSHATMLIQHYLDNPTAEKPHSVA